MSSFRNLFHTNKVGLTSGRTDPNPALMFPIGHPSFCVLQNMEKDKALERRFQQVFVKQPNVEDTVGPSREMEMYRCDLGYRRPTETGRLHFG